QTVHRWEAEMAGAVGLAPDHLSCYTLTIEPGTPMARRVQDGAIRLPDEATVGDLFDATAAFLEGSGYRWYEVSNFARHAAGLPDRRSRHNRKYWTLAPYLGFGPAAHSFLNATRWWNHRSLDDYLADVAAGKAPVSGRETLTQGQQIMEYVYLGLRQTDGIDTADFCVRFGEDLHRRFARQLPPLVAEEMLEASGGRIRATRRGMRFLESVADRLLA
ncbi:MAG TPA: coproporphyrinogen III oxidase family protein, partial [Desulfosarcina sp.]|nr:coproporphyrinogen III oxidase family protein [Desulfosarcina sp.]